LSLAREAGIVFNEDLIDQWESIGGRGFVANYEAIQNFAQLVGKEAREHERSKAKSQAEENERKPQRSFDGGAD